MPPRNPKPETRNPTNPTFALLIANWNGEAYIERCLGSVLAAVRRTGVEMEVVVVDDASADRSTDLIATGFPGVRLIRLERNVGFGAAVGRGMAELDADWVFLLNNDLALRVDFCERLIRTLNEQDAEKVFTIGALTLDWETQEPNHGGQLARWRAGMIVQEPFEADRAGPADFAQAGACLLNRAKFLDLGGFADIYHPGYWEDYDLTWQARRAGWLNLYEPRAVAYHRGKGSMRELLGPWGLSLTLGRNHLLFNWASLRDVGMIARHLSALPRWILTDPLRPAEASRGRVLWAALGRLPRLLRLRRRRAAIRGLSDRELLADSRAATAGRSVG